MKVNVEYLAHSGYVVETDHHVMIFDYVDGNLPRHYLDNHKYTVFFVTHSHDDHYHPGIFKYKKDVIVSEDVRIPIKEQATIVRPFDSLILNGIKVNVFGSTDLGVSYLVNSDGVSIFHAGDLNDWHWKEESTIDEIELANFQFLNIIEDLKDHAVDIAMFPVDPRMRKDFDQGARTYIQTIRPTWFFPMHYADTRSIRSFEQWASKQKGTKIEIPFENNQRFTCEV